MILEGINFNDHESKTGGNFLPVGKYPCKTIKTEAKRNKNNKVYLELTWQCGSGDHEGATTKERKYLTLATAPYVKGWAKNVMNITLDSDRVNEKIFNNRYADVVVKQQDDNDRYTEADSFRSEELFNYNKPAKASEGASQVRSSNLPSDSDQHDTGFQNSAPPIGGYGGNNNGSNFQLKESSNVHEITEDDIPFF